MPWRVVLINERTHRRSVKAVRVECVRGLVATFPLARSFSSPAHPPFELFRRSALALSSHGASPARDIAPARLQREMRLVAIGAVSVVRPDEVIGTDCRRSHRTTTAF